MKLSKTAIMIMASCLAITGTMSSCSSSVSENVNNIDLKEREQFKNLIDVTGVPLDAKPSDSYEITPFSDLGAWHGYSLPGLEDKEYYGGFVGPLYIAEEYGIWLSKSFNKIKICNGKTGEEIKLSDCSDPKMIYYPGMLFQEYNLNDFTLDLSLIFGTNRTAIVTTKIKNNTNKELNLKVSWVGEILRCYNDKEREDIKYELVALKDGVKVKFPNTNWTWDAFTNNDMEYEVRYPNKVITTVNEGKYEINLPKNIKVKPKDEYVINTAHTYTFTKDEKQKENAKIEDILKNTGEYINENNIRWNDYISHITNENNLEIKYKNVAVKALITLVSNWRSPAGAIKNDGITPSISYKWFNGLWAWDSWKHAVAAVDFNPKLAENNIRAMFDYQKDDGMVIDAVFYNKNGNIYEGEKGGNWNERNSKPPLSAWAVWNIYETTKDKDFIIEMYPKLVKYHKWWYENRDNDKNGIAEYGGTVDPDNNKSDSIISAAAWESGMDNAPRFDAKYGVKVLENKDKNGKTIGYSINQESVDLNSYLYAEKIYLSKMAELLNKPEDKERFNKEAEYVKEYIQKYMFDEKEGFFFDIDLNTKKPLKNRGKGPEGWIPLWANAASKEQAEKVKNNMMDEKKFNTKMPLPTASKDNPGYEASKYWRGPVWLDQAYFGVEGLYNYGYKDEAKNISHRLIDNAEGLVDDSKPIRENYNPETGKGLSCTNFSWSAASFYLLLKNYFN